MMLYSLVVVGVPKGNVDEYAHMRVKQCYEPPMRE